MTEHTIEPFFDKDSKVLILGSFPSVASRESGFYYGHKQNRFRKVISTLASERTPETLEEKMHLLKKHNIALWDVIASCDIKGSQDSSIDNVTVNELSRVLAECNITRIFVNGRKAYELYNKYLCTRYGKAEYLPSTSAASEGLGLSSIIAYPIGIAFALALAVS